MSKTYLAHHGILGQRWGVRRYQNKDGTLTAAGRKKYLGDSNYREKRTINKDDIIIKRGSIRSHVSEKKALKLEEKETYLYDPKNEHDKNVYEGAYAEYIRLGKGFAKQYVHDYVVTEDLISPSEKKRVDLFIESYKKDPTKYYTEMNAMVRGYKRSQEMGYNLSERNKKIANYGKAFNEKTSDKELRKYGYDVLSAVAETGSRRSQAINDYYKNIMSKGYNSIVDDNNRSVYNDAVLPFIALNGKKTLKELNSYRLSDIERRRNIEELRDYKEKKYGNRNIML